MNDRTFGRGAGAKKIDDARDGSRQNPGVGFNQAVSNAFGNAENKIADAENQREERQKAQRFLIGREKMFNLFGYRHKLRNLPESAGSASPRACATRFS